VRDCWHTSSPATTSQRNEGAAAARIEVTELLELANALGQRFDVGSLQLTWVSGGDTASAYRVQLDDGRILFVKHVRHSKSSVDVASGTVDDVRAGMFEAEHRGLELLGSTGVVPVPEVIAWSDESPAFLVLAWIHSAPPAVDHDETLGRSLAALHTAPFPNFGLDHHNWVGSVQQLNTPVPTWPEFFAVRRLIPLFTAAVAAGAVDPAGRITLDRVIHRLPALCGPPEAPALLHGDLWAGNAITDASGNPVVIDPAVYGGHREIDLAMMRLFGGFSARVFDAYAEASPLADGHAERVALYQLPPLLVHAVLFGAGFGERVVEVLRRYA